MFRLTTVLRNIQNNNVNISENTNLTRIWACVGFVFFCFLSVSFNGRYTIQLIPFSSREERILF